MRGGEGGGAYLPTERVGGEVEAVVVVEAGGRAEPEDTMLSKWFLVVVVGGRVGRWGGWEEERPTFTDMTFINIIYYYYYLPYGYFLIVVHYYLKLLQYRYMSNIVL